MGNAIPVHFEQADADLPVDQTRQRSTDVSDSQTCRMISTICASFSTFRFSLLDSEADAARTNLDRFPLSQCSVWIYND